MSVFIHITAGVYEDIMCVNVKHNIHITQITHCIYLRLYAYGLDP